MTFLSQISAEDRYLQEARSWDQSLVHIMQKSHRRAWRVAFACLGVAFLEAGALMSLMPLKSIEPFVIRVDQNTGYTDVISQITKTQGKQSQTAQEALDKYFLTQYLQAREAYQWHRRDYDRRLVGLMSEAKIQQVYAQEQDPKNTESPVKLYGDTGTADITITAISFLKQETIDGIAYRTALVRYLKKVGKQGEAVTKSHWVATIRFYYADALMHLADRQLNPLGFQVSDYRKDQETTGAVYE